MPVVEVVATTETMPAPLFTARRLAPRVMAGKVVVEMEVSQLFTRQLKQSLVATVPRTQVVVVVVPARTPTNSPWVVQVDQELSSFPTVHPWKSPKLQVEQGLAQISPDQLRFS